MVRENDGYILRRQQEIQEIDRQLDATGAYVNEKDNTVYKERAAKYIRWKLNDEIEERMGVPMYEREGYGFFDNLMRAILRAFEYIFNPTYRALKKAAIGQHVVEEYDIPAKKQSQKEETMTEQDSQEKEDIEQEQSVDLDDIPCDIDLDDEEEMNTVGIDPIDFDSLDPSLLNGEEFGPVTGIPDIIEAMDNNENLDGMSEDDISIWLDEADGDISAMVEAHPDAVAHLDPEDITQDIASGVRQAKGEDTKLFLQLVKQQPALAQGLTNEDLSNKKFLGQMLARNYKVLQYIPADAMRDQYSGALRNDVMRACLASREGILQSQGSSIKYEIEQMLGDPKTKALAEEMLHFCAEQAIKDLAKENAGEKARVPFFMKGFDAQDKEPGHLLGDAMKEAEGGLRRYAEKTIHKYQDKTDNKSIARAKSAEQLLDYLDNGPKPVMGRLQNDIENTMTDFGEDACQEEQRLNYTIDNPEEFGLEDL